MAKAALKAEAEKAKLEVRTICRCVCVCVREREREPAICLFPSLQRERAEEARLRSVEEKERAGLPCQVD